MPQLNPIKTSTDIDGDVIMSDTSPPSNSIKDKSIFDWFSFEEKTAPLKGPTYSPVSPNQKPILSASTASPSSYFTNSPYSADVKSQRPLSPQRTTPSKVKYPPPPAKALKWVWQCHLCNSRYPLAVTRRCLNDGHYYCSGNSQTQRNVKKRRRNQSCTSEFDYVAWKEWGQWRRKTMALQAFADHKDEPKLLGCEGCSSPSQCRYERRKRVEIIKFDDFIEDEDLILDAKKGSIVTHSTTEEKVHQSKRVKVPLPEAEKDTKVKKLTSKKVLKIDSTALSSTLNQKPSGRHRFYSSLSSSLSSRDVSPTSELLGTERGKFDPTLPSVTRLASEEKDDLAAIESTLKAALTKQKQQSSSASVTQGSTGQPTPKTKRRLNTKKDDPQFDITAQDKPVISLQRTASQPTLLTDFFRQSKLPTSLGPTPVRKDGRAASEADITAFLRSMPTRDIEDFEDFESQPVMRRQSSASVPASSISHFEDIDLSESSTSSKDNLHSRNSGAPKKNEISAEDLPVQVQVNPSAGGKGGGGENAGNRNGLGFGLTNFGFGRK